MSYFSKKKKELYIQTTTTGFFVHRFAKEIFFSGNLGTWQNNLLHL